MHNGRGGVASPSAPCTTDRYIILSHGFDSSVAPMTGEPSGARAIRCPECFPCRYPRAPTSPPVSDDADAAISGRRSVIQP
jgi:hypothetical protein